MKLYLDSNVLISYLRNEIDYAFNLRFQDSSDFFTTCKEEKHKIIISDLFIKEITKTVSLNKEDIKTIFDDLKIEVVFVEKVEKEKAIEIMHKTGLHFLDSVHVGTAIKEKCGFTITWNAKDFEKTKNLMPFKTPKEFIDKDV